MSANTFMQVDENMGIAQKRDAALSGKFYFRKNVFPPSQAKTSPCTSTPSSGTSSPCNGISEQKEKKMRNCFPTIVPPEEGFSFAPVEDEYEEMTMNEIMDGKVWFQASSIWKYSLDFLQSEAFPGLLGLVYAYLDTLDLEESDRIKIEKYLDLIRRRSNGSFILFHQNFVKS
jgi:glutamate--cysteine ligase catalytic subunit